MHVNLFSSSFSFLCFILRHLAFQSFLVLIDFVRIDDYVPNAILSSHPQVLVTFGFLKTKRLAKTSSRQSIVLPRIFNKLIPSTTTLTPSCSTTSSKRDGEETYSNLYAPPAHPFAMTLILIRFGGGWHCSVRRWESAVGVIVKTALRCRFGRFTFIIPSVFGSVLIALVD